MTTAVEDTRNAHQSPIKWANKFIHPAGSLPQCCVFSLLYFIISFSSLYYYLFFVSLSWCFDPSDTRDNSTIIMVSYKLDSALSFPVPWPWKAVEANIVQAPDWFRTRQTPSRLLCHGIRFDRCFGCVKRENHRMNWRNSNCSDLLRGFEVELKFVLHCIVQFLKVKEGNGF